MRSCGNVARRALVFHGRSGVEKKTKGVRIALATSANVKNFLGLPAVKLAPKDREYFALVYEYHKARVFHNPRHIEV